MTDRRGVLQVPLTGDELQMVTEALERLLDWVYGSNSDVEYKHTRGEEIWNLRERMRKAMVNGGLDPAPSRLDQDGNARFW